MACLKKFCLLLTGLIALALFYEPFIAFVLPIFLNIRNEYGITFAIIEFLSVIFSMIFEFKYFIHILAEILLAIHRRRQKTTSRINPKNEDNDEDECSNIQEVTSLEESQVLIMEKYGENAVLLLDFMKTVIFIGVVIQYVALLVKSLWLDISFLFFEKNNDFLFQTGVIMGSTFYHMMFIFGIRVLYGFRICMHFSEFLPLHEMMINPETENYAQWIEFGKMV